MRITNNITFGKKLVATCNLPIQNGSTMPCNIFELNNNEDKDYFEKLKNKPIWNGSKFLRSMDGLIKSGSIGKENDTFSLENQNEECLGFISVITHKKPQNRKFIYTIETAPKYSSQKREKTTQQIGRSLVAVIVKQAQQENRDKVSVLAFNSDERKFFKHNCGFKVGDDNGFSYILPKKHYSKFLEKHTKTQNSKIDFIK
jgi:hypothetical protein